MFPCCALPFPVPRWQLSPEMHTPFPCRQRKEMQVKRERKQSLTFKGDFRSQQGLFLDAGVERSRSQQSACLWHVLVFQGCSKSGSGRRSLTLVCVSALCLAVLRKTWALVEKNQPLPKAAADSEESTPCSLAALGPGRLLCRTTSPYVPLSTWMEHLHETIGRAQRAC